MKVCEALEQRKSVRAFLDKPVEKAAIIRILNAARHAPSGTNTQPWNVAVVMGDEKRKLDTLIENEFRTRGEGKLPYNYYPVEWKEPYKSRRKACGLQLYSAVNIGRNDKEKRLAQWAANYRAFDAPVAMFFFLEDIMEIGSYMDYGMFLQSIMLAAVEEGLATCPQAALGQYPELVRGELGYADNFTLLCGMALGYEDSSAPVNTYRTPREEVNSFTRFFE